MRPGAEIWSTHQRLITATKSASGIALWLENLPFAFLLAIGGLMDALKKYGNDAVRIV
jgi:hypothetical protein